MSAPLESRPDAIGARLRLRGVLASPWIPIAAAMIMMLAARRTMRGSDARALAVDVMVGAAAALAGYGWHWFGARARRAPGQVAAAERLHLALGAADTALWDADTTTGRVRLDERWSIMLGGGSRESLVSLRQLARIAHPDDRDRVLQLQREVIGGTVDEYQVDHRVRTESGAWIWIHSRGRVIARDANRRATRMIGANTDITARKRAEAAVESQNAFLATLQKITLELLEHREIPDLLKTLLDRATTLLEATHGQIMLKERDALVVRTVTGNVPARLLGQRVERTAGVSWQAHDTGLPVVACHSAGEDGRQDRYGEIGLCAVAEFPILIKGRCFGVLVLGRDRPGRSYRPEEIERGTLLAQMASLVIHNAGLRAAALEEAAARTAALRESEEKFRAVFNHTPLPMSLSTIPDGRVVEGNAALCEAFGYTREEALNRSTTELQVWMRDADRRKFVRRFEAAAPATGIETTLRRKNGERFEALCHGSVVRIGGRPYALTSVLDITARKQAEQALRESEEKFRAVFDKSPIPIVLSALPDGTVVDANAAAAAAFGHDLSAGRGRTTEELNIWVDPAQRAGYLERLHTRGMLAGYEALLRRRDGQTLTVLFYSNVVRIGERAYVLNSILDITERKQSEQARDRSLSLMLATLDSTADGILVANLEGGIETFNRTFGAMWSLPREVLVARDSARVRECMIAQLRDPRKFTGQMDHLAAHPREESFDDLELVDGRVFERYSRPQFVNGAVVGRVWSFRDISARKAAEAAIRESEEKFRGVFDKSPIPIALSALPGGELVAVNPAAIALFGFEGRHVIGHSSLELGVWANPADRDHFMRQLTERGAINGFEVTMRTLRGDEVALLLNATTVQIGGRPYTLTSLLDLTERKRAESRFRDLFEFAPDAIVIGTREGQITDLNRRATELFGYSREELIGRPVAVLIPEEGHPLIQERLARYLANPVPHPMGTSEPGLKARSKAGRTFPIDVGLSPLRTGAAELVVAAIRDTTEQERATAQQRTLEVQLRQAQKMEALGTLAGGIAHDFNNLLTAILGHAELAALDLPAMHGASGSVRAVRDAALRSRDLVKQILTFSRRTETELAPMKLQTIVEDTFRLLRSTIPAMVRIERHVQPDCAPICGDATQIHQVLMNLCMNAWQALPAHGGVLGLRLEQCAIAEGEDEAPEIPAGDYARVSVIDNGHGMDAPTLERIYDPFFTTKPVGKGTGLGLSMVHGIVETHAGFIRVASRPGQGTRFDVYLPTLREPMAPPGDRTGHLERGAGERVFYIDDDEHASVAIAALLRHLGYRVVHRALPVDALALFRAAPHAHDLIITDLAMPGMSGTELAAEIRRLRPDLPVLLITGYVDNSQDDALRRIGVREVLRKPVTPQSLADSVRRALGRATTATRQPFAAV